jgi:hypothetical protein
MGGEGWGPMSHVPVEPRRVARARRIRPEPFHCNGLARPRLAVRKARAVAAARAEEVLDHRPQRAVEDLLIARAFAEDTIEPVRVVVHRLREVDERLGLVHDETTAHLGGVRRHHVEAASTSAQVHKRTRTRAHTHRYTRGHSACQCAACMLICGARTCGAEEISSSHAPALPQLLW